MKCGSASSIYWEIRIKEAHPSSRRFIRSAFACCGAMGTLAEIRNGFTRRFTIYDDDDQVSLLKSIYKQLGLDEKFMPYRAALAESAMPRTTMRRRRIGKSRDRSETNSACEDL